jgi:Tol biopolymer transport system component
MWIGDKIYFNSDRTGTPNLDSYDLANGATRQLTNSTQWDVRWPSADADGQIAYEMNGELNVFDTRTGQSRHLAIDFPGDGLDTTGATTRTSSPTRRSSSTAIWPACSTKGPARTATSFPTCSASSASAP